MFWIFNDNARNRIRVSLKADKWADTNMYDGQRFKNSAFRQSVRINFRNNFAGRSSGEGSFWKKFFVDLCNNLSFHGLNHFVDNERSAVEKWVLLHFYLSITEKRERNIWSWNYGKIILRIFWSCLIVGAIFGAVTSIRQIWLNYIRSSTETVVETTYFKYSQIAFPAVIICEASRVDWNRVLKLNERYTCR